MGKKFYRPLGVTILGIWLIIYAIIGFLFALFLLGLVGETASDEGNLSPIIGGVIAVGGFLYLLIALSRFTIAIGVLKMKRSAWKGAFFIIGFGMIIDIMLGQIGTAILGVITLIYLILVKKQFKYRGRIF